MTRAGASTSGSNLLSISKRGDAYLRTLLILGARSVLYRGAAGGLVPLDQFRRPATQQECCGSGAGQQRMRVVWALLAQERSYQATRYVRATETA